MCNKKRNRLELILVLAIFFVIAGVISPRAIQADSGAKFSVSINNNSQQIDPQLPYFNLNMQPNSETNLSLNIYNRSKKAAKFTVWANKAITNNNMIIDYSARKITKSPNLPSTLNIYKMISPKVQNIQVPANGTKKIAFKLKMPDQQFNGRLLGGIYVRKQIEKSVKSGFTNRLNFATAIVIRQNNRQVKPELNLNKVRINNLNWTRTVEAGTQNVSKTYLSHVKTAAKIYPAKNPKKIVIRQKLDNRSIAPNSSFNYQLPLKNQKLKPGKYILDLKFISKKPDQIWHWKRSFVITSKNVQDVTIQHNNHLWIWILFIALVLVIVLALYLWWRKWRRYENKH